MSKIFFDHLVSIRKVRRNVSRIAQSVDEKEDLWGLIDEYINRRIILSILEQLDENYHEEFISSLLDKPYDTGLIDYLDKRLPCPFCKLMEQLCMTINEDLWRILEIPISARIQKRIVTSR